jgi:hypothetical protein
MRCFNTVLGIEHCSRITDCALAAYIERSKELRFLSIDGCSNASVATLSALQGLHWIRDLFMNTCEKIDDRCMSKLLMGYTQVNMHQCSKLITIGTHAGCEKQISSLGVEECSISDKSVLLIAKYCPNMQVLGTHFPAHFMWCGICHPLLLVAT